ncbi:MAG: hypothetical protein JEY91_04895 [Spirochaetaceae bacterium]|nr:hypothetical protein [Spirochaetaceae bacterium]
MRKILEFSLKNSLFIIVINVLLTLIMIFFASKIEMNSEITALMPDTNPASDLVKKYDPEDRERNAFFLALESKGPLSKEGLAVYEQVIGEVNELTGGYCDSIFSATTFLKRGGRLAPKPLVPNRIAPKTDAEFEELLSNLDQDVFSRKIFYTHRGNILNTIFYHPVITK